MALEKSEEYLKWEKAVHSCFWMMLMLYKWLSQLAIVWLWDLMQRRWHEGYLGEKFVNSTTWHWMNCNSYWSNQKSNFGLPNTRQTLMYKSDSSRDLSRWSTWQHVLCWERQRELGLGLYSLQKALAASCCCLKPCNRKLQVRDKLLQVVCRGCKIYMFEGIQNSAAQNPKQYACWSCLEQGAWLGVLWKSLLTSLSPCIY